MKQYTREEVIEIIYNLLQYPDQLRDAVDNENTIWDAEELMSLVTDEYIKP